jgi:hypothetical protein
MSVNPMDYRPYLEIWRGAYLSTLKRVHALGYRMRGDLAVHGIPFDTARADEVAARLRHRPTATFADFFPDGKVDLRVPARTRRANLRLVPRAGGGQTKIDRSGAPASAGKLPSRSSENVDAPRVRAIVETH